MGVLGMFWPLERGPAMLFHEETVPPRGVAARQHQPLRVRRGPEGVTRDIGHQNARRCVVIHDCRRLPYHDSFSSAGARLLQSLSGVWS